MKNKKPEIIKYQAFYFIQLHKNIQDLTAKDFTQ